MSIAAQTNDDGTTRAPRPSDTVYVALIAYKLKNPVDPDVLLDVKKDPPAFAVKSMAPGANGVFVGTFSAPDLVIKPADVPVVKPGLIGPGESFTVGQWTLTNQGTNKAEAEDGSFTHRAYLSSNQNWDAQDTLIGTIGDSAGALGAAASSPFVATTLTMPADVQPGNYSLLLFVDASREVSEFDEPNNVIAIPITIRPLNDPPVAQSQTISVPQNGALPIKLSATDPNGDALTFAIVSGPSHGTLSALGSVTCSGSPSSCTVGVTYTPSTNYAGPDSFTFTAHDGKVASAVATISITVNGGLADFGFVGLLSPWKEKPTYSTNKGSVVPLSWRYTKDGKPTDTSKLTPEVRMTKLNSNCSVPAAGEGIPIVNRNTPGSTFFSYINTSTTPHTWQFNLKTDLPEFTTGCWNIRIYLVETQQLDRPEGFKIILK